MTVEQRIRTLIERSRQQDERLTRLEKLCDRTKEKKA